MTLCRQEARSFGQRHPGTYSIRLAVALLMLPGCEPHSVRPLLTDFAEDSMPTPERQHHWISRQLYAYRTGDFEKAATPFQSTAQRPLHREYTLYVLAFRAMALHRLGQDKEAREVLAEARQLDAQLRAAQHNILGLALHTRVLEEAAAVMKE